MNQLAEKHWHALPVTDVQEAFGTNPEQGLSDIEIASRQLSQVNRRVTGDAFGQPWRAMPDLVFLLIGGILLLYLALTWLLEDALVILSSLALLGVFTFFLHHWTVKKLAARPTARPTAARVLRNGRDLNCPAEQLVVGDIVFLEPGDAVMADMRLLESDMLVVDEHWLMEGHEQVYKQTSAVDEQAPLALRSTMVFAGSHVVSGYGKAIVTDIGDATQQQWVYRTMHARPDVQGRDILQARAVMRRAAYLALLGVSLLFAFGLFWQKIQMHELFYAALVMVLSAVPFFLPLALQIVDYWGALALNRQKAHIRAPEAVALMQGIDVLVFGKANLELMERLDAKALQQLGARAVFCLDVSEKSAAKLPDSIRWMQGSALLAMDAESAQQAALKTDVFLGMDVVAKQYLLAALRSEGRTVAYVGQHNDDVSVMRQADCTISLGDITPYLRAHSDVVLGEMPVLESIRDARSVGMRIIDIWHFLLTVSAAKGTVLGWAILSGSVLPMAPLQLLYTALVVTPVLAICLAVTPFTQLPDRLVSVRGVQARKRLLPWVLIGGCMMTAAAVYGSFLNVTDAGGSPYVAGSLAWLIMVFMEIMVMLVIDGGAMLKQRRVWCMLGGLLVLQAILMLFPILQHALLVALPAPALLSQLNPLGPLLLASILVVAFIGRRWWLHRLGA